MQYGMQGCTICLDEQTRTEFCDLSSPPVALPTLDDSVSAYLSLPRVSPGRGEGKGRRKKEKMHYLCASFDRFRRFF
jgi:hypothetical protein